MPKTLDYDDGIPTAGLANAPGWITQRRTILAASCLTFLVAFVLFAGDAWPVALHGLLTDVVLAVVWLLSAKGIGSTLIRPFTARAELGDAPDQSAEKSGPLRTSARGVVSPDAPLRHITATAMGIGAIGLLTLFFGLAGVLNRFTAWTMIAVGLFLLIAPAIHRFERGSFECAANAWLRADARHAWFWLPAVVTLALACVSAMALPGSLWNSFGDPHGYDVVEYHLQIPREWFERGRIVPLHHNAFSFFPFNVETHYLLAMHLKGGPWAGMYLAQFMHVAFVALTVITVYGAARALGAARSASVVGGSAVAATPWTLLLAPIAYNEGGLLLFGVLATAWTVMAVQRQLVAVRADQEKAGNTCRHVLKPYALGGVMAGLACGAKLTAVPTVLVALAAVAFASLLLARRPFTRALVGPLTFFITGLLTFSPWLIRNVCWAGNPVFPEAASILGKGHFTDVQVERWARAHRATPDKQSLVARVKAAGVEIGEDWRYGYVVLPIGLAAGLTTIRRRGSITLLTLFGAMLLFWLGFTHLQSRFFVLSIPVAALLISLVPWRWWPIAVAGVLLAPYVMLWSRCAEELQKTPLAIEDVHELVPLLCGGNDAVANQIRSANRISLIGDAKAFWYATPRGGLRYRTVFDVTGGPDTSVIDAWTAGALPGDGNDLIIIDAGELDRMAKTYWGIPPLRPGDGEDRPERIIRR